MKAIVVKYIGATNTKPARLKATASGVPAITKSRHAYDDDLEGSPELMLARELAAKYRWPGELIEGTLPNGDAVFVFVPGSA